MWAYFWNETERSCMLYIIIKSALGCCKFYISTHPLWNLPSFSVCPYPVSFWFSSLQALMCYPGKWGPRHVRLSLHQLYTQRQFCKKKKACDCSNNCPTTCHVSIKHRNTPSSRDVQTLNQVFILSVWAEVLRCAKSGISYLRCGVGVQFSCLVFSSCSNTN